MKLTTNQIATLRRLANAADGGELTPSGSAAAGRYASAWWRTMKSLNSLGLVTWRLGTNFVRITDKGRALVVGT